MTLALFDFDGTITNKDSLVDFIQFSIGKPKYYLGLLYLSPMLFLYKLKVIPNYVAKQKLLKYFFKNWLITDFTQTTEFYSLHKLNAIIRPEALKKIQWHQEQGHTIVIVSASIQEWLKPWCNTHNLDLLSTELEVIGDKISGNFSTKNCYGIEKVKRVQQKYNLNQYSTIYAYGDSAGDKELLEIAQHKFYKPFRLN